MRTRQIFFVESHRATEAEIDEIPALHRLGLFVGRVADGHAWTADRVLLAHDPRALQQLAIDQLKAFPSSLPTPCASSPRSSRRTRYSGTRKPDSSAIGAVLETRRKWVWIRTRGRPPSLSHNRATMLGR